MLEYSVVAIASRLHIISPDLPTGIAFRNVTGCFTLHSCPPRLLPQVMIHLSAPRMNEIPRCMGFIQNLLFQSLFPRHYRPLLELQGSLGILMETSDLWVTFFHSSLNMIHAIVILLSSMISSLKDGVRVMLNNDTLGSTRVLDSSPVKRTAGK
jgi:hypothetical protein